MKKEIYATFEETLTRTVALTVDSENELDQQVRQAYQNEQVVLSATDLTNAQYLINTPTTDTGWVEI
ncbi:DpnD/PcfM family protein [Weissella paramesenteroides]|uniref:DpnD/PcfM family protein n=1 Tax=Weissella paramesenteroides TaxID=1249 RepID=UPI0023FA0BF6|nr:DpnD/PcfM family protein [Weissella paramesenteroides]MDF8372609.1 hypothetical protein [Weissella paramesenteroides]WIG66385.1 hypothetical protein G9U56_05215 [Weissella paramesenteroides]